MPFKPVETPKDQLNMLIASALRIAGLFAVLMAAAMAPNAANPRSSAFWRFLVPAATFLVGYSSLIVARRLRSGVVARSKMFAPAEFVRLPVEKTAVLLRSFSDDEARLPTRLSMRLSDAELLSLESRADRFERVLSWCLWPFMPAFALTDPVRAHRIDPGCCRILLPETEDWQPLAEELIRRCAVIVLLVGESPSLLWEVEHITDRDRLDRTLFVIPPGTDRSARIRTVAARTRLPEPVVADDQPVVGFSVLDGRFRWYRSDILDEHAYAAMVEQFLLERGLAATEPAGIAAR
jgi:hypothetical protein